jgi:hypothetical protein
MVAVASGNSSQVENWSQLLLSAGIVFTVAKYDHGTIAGPQLDYAELWVAGADVSEARATIRSAPNADRSLLW